MCGRYASFREAQDLADAFGVAEPDVAADARLLPPSWNVAPTDPVRIVVERAPKEAAATQPPGQPRRSLRLARWGLVPGWAKDPSVGSRMINARVESLATKPAFRRALVARRALVPAEGYYEWQTLAEEGVDIPGRGKDRQRKQAFWIHSGDGGLLAFAGLYEFWRDPSRAADDPLRWLVSMTIVTGDESTIDVHDRRPVVLAPPRWDAWLDPYMAEPEAVLDLLRDGPPPLVATPVSPAVNRVGNNGPELIEPLG